MSDFLGWINLMLFLTFYLIYIILGRIAILWVMLVGEYDQN